MNTDSLLLLLWMNCNDDHEKDPTMRRIYIAIMGWFAHADNLLPVLPIFLGIFLLVLAGSGWAPLYRLAPKEVINAILFNGAFFLFGVHGVVCALYQEFPVFWPPLKGKPAVFAGVVFAVGCFGVNVLWVVHNWKAITNW